LTVKAKPFWLLVIGTGTCWVLSYVLAPYLKEQILFAGTSLQVGGLLIVAEGIRRLRHDYNKTIEDWCRYVACAFRKPQTLYADDVTVTPHISSAELLAAESVSDITTEMRLDALEKSLSHLWEQHGTDLIGLERSISGVVSLIHDETDQRKSDVAGLREKIADVAVGGIHLETVGLVWLFVGMLGSSIPTELGNILNPLVSLGYTLKDVMFSTITYLAAQ